MTAAGAKGSDVYVGSREAAKESWARVRWRRGRRRMVVVRVSIVAVATLSYGAFVCCDYVKILWVVYEVERALAGS